MLIQRAITGVILGAAIIGSILFLPAIVTGLILGGLWLVGVHEWSKIAGLSNRYAVVFVFLMALFMVLSAQLFGSGLIFNVVLCVTGIWWLIAIRLLVTYPRQLSQALTVFAGIVILLPAWALLSWLYRSYSDGPWLVLTMLAIVWSADVGAYAFGRMFGRHKLAPKVSPGKTWEGVAGGLLLASCAGALASMQIGIAAIPFAILAAATAAISVIGDLTISMFKRNAGVKDSGSLLPGHGGVLDRIDSVSPAAAIFVVGIISLIT